MQFSQISGNNYPSTLLTREPQEKQITEAAEKLRLKQGEIPGNLREASKFI